MNRIKQIADRLVMNIQKSNKIVYHKKWDTKENWKTIASMFGRFGFDCWSVCPPSWAEEVNELLLKIWRKYPKIKFRQIKEKFCGLRIYYEIEGKYIRKDIEKMINETNKKLARKLKLKEIG